MSTLGDSPAFARNGSNSDFIILAQEGMSLRAWLAGQALAGLCANSDFLAEAGNEWLKTPDNGEPPELVARATCRFADATLKELAKEGR